MPEIDDTWTPAPVWIEWGVIVVGMTTLVVEIAGAVAVAGWMV